MVKGVTSIAQTDDNFICATLDWWPENKCDYNQCPWGKAGLLNLDLKNRILANAVKAFNPLRLRIGGSLQDQVYYKVGNYPKNCSNFEKKSDGLFGFSDGCLHMNRWDELHDMFNKTGAAITFSFNALIGRIPSDENNTTLWVGDWNHYNAKSLMKYTINKGYKIDSYELGNELCGSGVAAKIKAHQYGNDVKKLKKLVTHMYPNPANRPKILAPGGFYDQKWFQEFLQTTGPGVVDGLTHHIYNLGAGVDPTLIDKLQNPFYLSQIAQTFKNVENDAKLFSPSSGPWVGESGGAYNSGGKTTSHTFVNGFWYLDQLGMTSTFNHKVYCRQSLIGGNYGLLNTTSFIPNPDYYGALLWHKLMGKNVLSITHEGSPYIRTYAHCSKTSGITVLLINMDKSTTFDVSVVNDLNMYADSVASVEYINPNPDSVESIHPREEYHLTPKDGNIQSDVLLLNGTPLKLTSSLDIPVMKPKLVDPTLPISVAPQSIVFATLRGFQAPESEVVEKAKKAPSFRKMPTFGDSKPESEVAENAKRAPSMKRASTFPDQSIDIRPPKAPEVPVSAPTVPPTRQSSSQPGMAKAPNTIMPASGNYQADIWEKEEMEKIRIRYKKLINEIVDWETKKKKKAKRDLEKVEAELLSNEKMKLQAELDRRRAKARKHFNDEVGRIEGIAGGAKEQADQHRKNEELKVIEKANKIRVTGKMPSTCSCF